MNENEEQVMCSVCGNQVATHFYPGPLCEIDWQDWAE